MASERRALGTDETGAALLEAALVLPVLLVLVFGLMEVSLYLWTAGLAEKAVQIGVRRAVVSDPVAVGPGLEPEDSAAYWHGLPPGERCFPRGGERSPCPAFAVTCAPAAGCTCTGDACGFRLDSARLEPILAAMQAVLPALRAENLEIGYATNGLGYVAGPLPVPVDVRLRIVDLAYRPLLPGGLFGASLRLGAAAILPSESLRTVR